MTVELTGIKDIDNIIYDYKEDLEDFEGHKKKYKKVMKELQTKYKEKLYYITTSTKDYISAVTLGWDCYDVIILEPIKK